MTFFIHGGFRILNIEQLMIVHVPDREFAIQLLMTQCVDHLEEFDTAEEMKARLDQLSGWLGGKVLPLLNGGFINPKHIVHVDEVEFGESEDEDEYSVLYQMSNGQRYLESFDDKDISCERLIAVGEALGVIGEWTGELGG